MRKSCLFTAVVEHDVSGFVAGTTEADRKKLRRELGVQVRPESLEDFVGPLAPTGRQVDTADVWRLRETKPGASLSDLATELGCSLSTVKRHLKRKPQVKPVRVKPSMEQVWFAFTELRAARDGKPQLSIAS